MPSLAICLICECSANRSGPCGIVDETVSELSLLHLRGPFVRFKFN